LSIAQTFDRAAGSVASPVIVIAMNVPPLADERRFRLLPEQWHFVNRGEQSSPHWKVLVHRHRRRSPYQGQCFFYPRRPKYCNEYIENFESAGSFLIAPGIGPAEPRLDEGGVQPDRAALRDVAPAACYFPATLLRFPFICPSGRARNGLHFQQAHENNRFPAPSWSRSLLLRLL
jgi:hypothetical protein